MCTCPNGERYHVGDNDTACRTLSGCINGQVGRCHPVGFALDVTVVVECADLPPGSPPAPAPFELFLPSDSALSGTYRMNPIFDVTLEGLEVGNRDGEVPTRFFSFWNDVSHVPDFVASCWTRLIELNPSWTIHVLYPGIGGLQGPPASPNGFPSDDWAHIADWYRAEALAKYGGVWVDSTIIAMRPIDQFLNLSRGVMQGYKTFDTLENWFFVAPYNDLLMKAWLAEFTSAWTVGPDAYNWDHWYLYPPGLQSWMPYLTQHGCFLAALSRFPADSIFWLGSSTEDSPNDPTHPFWYGSRNGVPWDACEAAWAVFRYYGLDPHLDKPPFFKLRGGERNCMQSLGHYAGEGSRLATLLLDRLP